MLGRREIIERFHLRQTSLPEAMARLIKSINSAEIDDKFLATAKTANADYLVSADKDLLDLKRYKGVEIIDAETFLRILQK